MEKGLKNLTQAYRSAQKKLENGTYHDHEDSGIGFSDPEEESEDHHQYVDMPNMPPLPENHHSTYPGYPPQQQRVPSIQSMLHPMQHSMQQPMQQSLQQPMAQSMPHSIPQSMPQSMSQSMQQPMQQPHPMQQYSSHRLSHQQ
jgi:hypothetical protein